MKEKTKPKKGKHIVAQSISLKDSKGRTCIFMSAEDDCAVIALHGKEGQSVQIATGPEKWVGMDIHDSTGKVAIGMSINADGNPGIGIADHRSGMLTLIGAGPNSSEHEISVYKHGKLHWTSRKKPGKRKDA
jgi:hypothetical protein